MKYPSHVGSVLILICLFSVINPREAYAYLDPGTGSYFFQMLVAAVLGGLFAVKLFWGRIIVFLKRLFSRGQ